MIPIELLFVVYRFESQQGISFGIHISGIIAIQSIGASNVPIDFSCTHAQIRAGTHSGRAIAPSSRKINPEPDHPRLYDNSPPLISVCLLAPPPVTRSTPLLLCCHPTMAEPDHETSGPCALFRSENVYRSQFIFVFSNVFSTTFCYGKIM